MSGDAVVLAFGDSLTFGVGTEPESSYPAVLQRLIGRQVVRSGVPGEVSAQGRRRLQAVLERVAPDLVVLCHGGNDVLRRLDQAQLADNIQAMVAMSQEAGADVVLIAVPSRSVLLSDLDLYADIGDRRGAPVIDGLLSELLRTPALKSDAVHLNAAGYKAMAERVRDALADAGAI